jgi:hypothetical protein
MLEGFFVHVKPLKAYVCKWLKTDDDNESDWFIYTKSDLFYKEMNNLFG